MTSNGMVAKDRRRASTSTTGSRKEEQKIKQIYRDIGLKEKYAAYEEASYAEIMGLKGFGKPGAVGRLRGVPEEGLQAEEVSFFWGGVGGALVTTP